MFDTEESVCIVNSSSTPHNADHNLSTWISRGNLRGRLATMRPTAPATALRDHYAHSCRPHAGRADFSVPRRHLLASSRPTRKGPRTKLCSNPSEEDPPPEHTEKPIAKKDPEEYYVESLKKIGVDQPAAKRILTVWKEAGVDDPDALRRLYLKGTVRPIGMGLAQALLDLVAAAGAFSGATAFGGMTDFPFQLGVEAVCYFIGFYFVSNLFFDVVTLGVVGYSIVRFGTNPEAYVRAVEKIAGEFAVVAKVQATVDALKVAQALNTIADILREVGVWRCRAALQEWGGASEFWNLDVLLVCVGEELGCRGG